MFSPYGDVNMLLIYFSFCYGLQEAQSHTTYIFIITFFVVFTFVYVWFS